MNRHFFACGDKEVKKNGCFEVELLRELLLSQFGDVGKERLKMFLDIHAHSVQSGISIYAPKCSSDGEEERRLARILANLSEFFEFEHCKFVNEKPKANCARLGIYRDFGVKDSYTIETSCFGYY